MKATHIHYNCPLARPPAKKTKTPGRAQIDTLDVKTKKKERGELKKNTIQASQLKSKKKKDTPLKIVPVRVVFRFRHPWIRIRRNDALDATALSPPAIPPTRSAHLWDTPWPVLLCAFRHARRERYMRYTWFLPFPTLRAARRFSLRDNWGWERSRRGGLERRRWYRQIGRAHV